MEVAEIVLWIMVIQRYLRITFIEVDQKEKEGKEKTVKWKN